MTAALLPGRAIAERVFQEVAERAAVIVAEGLPPQLAFVMIGHSPPAELYASRLDKLASRVGIRIMRHVLDETVTEDVLARSVGALNADATVDGILVQMPLPLHVIGIDLSPLIDPRKDVDGITVSNAGRLYLGLPGQFPPTALAIMEVICASGVNPAGRHAVLVGRSNVVGHPVAEMLLNLDATLTVTHRQTAELGLFTRLGDLVVVAAGEPGLITADMIKPGAVIVDAGINVLSDGNVVGDVDFDACRAVASAITPVPGGVGQVTNAMLLRNLVRSAEQRLAGR